jgi:hypothetical protein
VRRQADIKSSMRPIALRRAPMPKQAVRPSLQNLYAMRCTGQAAPTASATSKARKWCRPPSSVSFRQGLGEFCIPKPRKPQSLGGTSIAIGERDSARRSQGQIEAAEKYETGRAAAIEQSGLPDAMQHH